MKITPISVTIFGHEFDVGYRMFEWHATFVLIGIAIILLLPGNAMQSGTFQLQSETFKLLNENGFSEEIVGTLLFAVGAMRLVALCSNGLFTGQWGPRLRAIGAMFGAVIWAQLAISLIYNYVISGRISVGIVIYISLTMFDMMSAYRAGADARAMRDAT